MGPTASEVPSFTPTFLPTAHPTGLPSLGPSHLPTINPTGVPSALPSPLPALAPSPVPTLAPTYMPTLVPTLVPTYRPTVSSRPTGVPSAVPTPVPTLVPTPLPTQASNVYYYRNDRVDTEGVKIDPGECFPTPYFLRRPPACFSQVTEDFFNFPLSKNFTGNRAKPFCADFDNDGDQDCLVGEENGKVHFLRNDGTPEDMAWTYVTDDFFEFDVGDNAAPFCTSRFSGTADDNFQYEGDYDCFVGNGAGFVFRFVKISRAFHSPSFAPTPLPTALPSANPTGLPTPSPSTLPTGLPTLEPTPFPSLPPTPSPSIRPTGLPSPSPTSSPTTGWPTPLPSPGPTLEPTSLPTLEPTGEPTSVPSPLPTLFCPNGTFFNSSNFLCDACPVGRYADDHLGKVTNDRTRHYECAPCSPGRFNNETGRADCFDCPVGRYQPNNGTIACIKCVPGRHNPRTGTVGSNVYGRDSLPAVAGQAGVNHGWDPNSCFDCKAGKYSLFGQENCTDCPPGRYIDDGVDYYPTLKRHNELADCLYCPKGMHTGKETGAVECVDCPGGRISTNETNVRCAKCAAGKYSTLKTTHCVDCLAGRFATRDSGTCTDCPAGKNSSAVSGKCTFCGAGFWSSQRSRFCFACRPGEYHNGTGGVDRCDSCPPGYYAGKPASAHCLHCRPGKYQILSGTDQCDTCEPGRFSGAAAHGCSDCPKGKFASAEEAYRCIDCPPGKHAMFPQMDTCEDCPVGTFSGVNGTVECTRCYMNDGLERRRGANGLKTHLTSPYTTESPGATSLNNCTVCLGHFYWDGFKCDPCPSGVVCDDPWEAHTLKKLVTRPGWFRFTPTSKKVYVCPYDTCLGGNVTHHSFKKVTYTKKHGYGTDYHSHDTSQCRAGSEGPLCAVCQEGFKIDRGTRRCEKCAVSGVQQAGIVAFLGLIVVILLVSLSKRLREILTWEAHTVEMLMMVVTTIQTIQLLTDNFERSGGQSPPGWYATFLSFCAMFSFDLSIIFQLECFKSLGDYYVNMLATSLVLLFAFIYFAFRYICSDNNERGVRFLGRFILLAKFTLPPISRTVIKSFTCGNFDGGDFSYMTMDYTVDCHSNHYRTFIEIYGGFMVAIFPAGIPLVGMFLLYDISRPLLRMDALRSSGAHGLTEAAFGADEVKSPIRRIVGTRGDSGGRGRGRGDDDDDSDEEIKEDFPRGGDAADDDDDDYDDDKSSQAERLDDGRKHHREPHAHIQHHKVLRGSPLHVLFQFLKPEFWWFEIADLARRILITCATLAFATSPKTFSESHKFHGSMASSSKLLFFALSVSSISIFLQREGNVYISWSLNLLKCIEHGQVFMVTMVLLARESGLFGSGYPSIPYYYGGLALLLCLSSMVFVIGYTLLPSLQTAKDDLHALGTLTFRETSDYLLGVRRNVLVQRADRPAMQQNRDRMRRRQRGRREDDDEPMDAADVRVVDAVITSEEFAQSNPMYAETETQRLRAAAREERERKRKEAEALARKMRRKGEKGTASSSDDADAKEERARRGVFGSIFGRGEAAKAAEEPSEGRQPLAEDLVSAVRAMGRAGLAPEMIAITLKVELLQVREVLGLGDEQDDDDETTPGFQDAGDQLDAGLGGAALQDSDRGGAAAERTLQRRAARRAKGSRRKDARLKQQLATNLALASARSPLHAELPTSGESAGEGEGDADVVVGDIVDVYPQAVGADLIPDMDGGTITVVDAVLEEDAGDANDEASDGGSVSSRKSRTNTTSRRRKKGEGKSSRRDAKSARAAKKREAAKRLPSAPSETESDALASAPEDDEEVLHSFSIVLSFGAVNRGEGFAASLAISAVDEGTETAARSLGGCSHTPSDGRDEGQRDARAKEGAHTSNNGA